MGDYGDETKISIYNEFQARRQKIMFFTLKW
jgi:hypothetical protein